MKRFFLAIFIVLTLLILVWSVLSITAQEDSLMQAIEEYGSVTVMVDVWAPAPTEQVFQSREATIAYRASVDAAQRQVFDQLPVGDGIHLRHVYENFPAFSAVVDAEGLRALRRARYVVRVSEVLNYRKHVDFSIPLIGADAFHNLGYTGRGVAIAILDDGLDITHPFFAGTTGTIIEACFNTTSFSPLRFGRCPGSNPNVAYGPGSSCADNDCDHGTHVAGIAAGDDRPTRSGVAPDADIIAINVFSSVHDWGICDGDPPCQRASGDDISAAIDYVIRLRNEGWNIVAVNMSLGSRRHTSPCVMPESRFTTLRYLQGVMPIASTGNDSWTNAMGWPACRPQVVAVGNTELNDQVSGTSNVAYFMDIFAPGTDIFSSVSPLHDRYPYWYKTGTSMSVPHVAGAFALMREAEPEMHVETILRIFKATGVPVTDQRSGGTVTAPRLDLNAALQFIQNPVQCNGMDATIYVVNGIVFGGPDNGKTYNGLLRGTQGLDVMVGTEGADRILGFSTNDYICGLGGDDVIYGHEGQDDIWGGDGNDVIYAGYSGDDVWGGAGNDVIELEEGTDYAYGGEGDDRIEGGTGQDTINGDAGNDVLLGEEGDDVIRGGDGDDIIYGMQNNDWLYGNGGNDLIFGYQGDDRMYGGEGTDDLLGGDNNDWLYGEGGDGDSLLGGNGDDRLSGGDGVDDACYGDAGPHDYADDTCEIRATEH